MPEIELGFFKKNAKKWMRIITFEKRKFEIKFTINYIKSYKIKKQFLKSTKTKNLESSMFFNMSLPTNLIKAISCEHVAELLNSLLHGVQRSGKSHESFSANEKSRKISEFGHKSRNFFKIKFIILIHKMFFIIFKIL